MRMNFNRLPVLSRTLLFIVLPAILLLLWAYLRLLQSEPVYQGQITLSGLSAKVEINFDPQGVPMVSAKTDQDAYFAQGYLHASERLWQLELQRRQVDGRLSELFGQQSVGLDTWMRTLGLKRAAERAWSNLSPQTQVALESYAAGINAWVGQAQQLPAEFGLFEFEPQPWTAIDSLAWQKSFALNLGLNMFDEIHRMQGLKYLSLAQLQTFYPDDDLQEYQSWQQQDSAMAQANTEVNNQVFDSWPQLASAMEQQLATGGLHVGSNTWVVAGKHTQSGQPILANDPHLSVQQPSLWYAIGLQGDKLKVTGMSLVGLPGVTLGSNQHISWGVASLMSDQQDLFVLQSPAGQPDVYYSDGGTKVLQHRQEVIHIRRNSPQFLHNVIKPITVTVRDSELGPVVSDVVNSDGLTLALRWSALDDQDHSMTAMLALQYAQGWPQFRHSLKLYRNPGLHFTYADNSGNIGSQVSGYLPKRLTGSGILPRNGANVEYHWQGYVPFEQLPWQYNPTSGYLVNANQAVKVGGDYAISHEWAPDTRAERIKSQIEQLTSSGNKLTVAQMQALQGDVVNVEAQALARWLVSDELKAQLGEAIKGLKPSLITVANQLLSDLAQWQGAFEQHSVEASVYIYWRDEFKRQLFNKSAKSHRGFAIPASINNVLIGRIFEGQILAVVNGQNRHWCEPQRCRQLAANSFANAIDELRKQTRSVDSDDWQWGKLHQVQYEHRPFSHIKPLDLFYRHKFAVAGSANTVNAANAVAGPELGYRQTFGAAFRTLFELHDTIKGYYALPMGQSGHILSGHYDDQVSHFLTGQQFGFASNDSGAKRQLQLLPKETN